MDGPMREGAVRASTGRPMLRAWTLRVVDAHDVEPRMRRVRLTADDLHEMDYRPGQDIVLQVPLGGGETGRRHYTIRRLDKGARLLEIDVLLHGDTPGPAWARGARPGDLIEARGPRGRTVVDPAADWHLFCGDETGLPAILHMLETLPEGARAFVFLETGSPEDRVPMESPAEVTVHWVFRQGMPPGPSTLLLDRLGAFELPDGRGKAYITGETSNVRRQRQSLIARGMTRDQVAAEGYWRPGRAGGHDHVDD
jgi:NADPH-dependent ferric siderophore reductase